MLTIKKILKSLFTFRSIKLSYYIPKLILLILAVFVIIFIIINSSTENQAPADSGLSNESEATGEYVKSTDSAEFVSENPITDWPTMMGNNQRNSRSPLKSNLTNPFIEEPYYFGNYEGYLLLHKSNEDTVPDIGSYQGGLSNWAIEHKYGIKGIKFTVNHLSFSKNMSQNNRILRLYDGQLNNVYVTEDRSNPTLVVEKVTGPSGQTKPLWSSKLPYYNERPHIALADMNNDGVKDIIINGWQGVMVFDSKKHNLIMQLPQSELHNGRKRGYLAVKDINRDNYPEVFILSIYPWDINVINNDGKKLSKNWMKIYDNHIESARIITAYTRNPIEDYNNDGKYEIVFNIWNEAGDGEWHVKVLDALTGDEVMDIPKAYLQDAVDIDGEKGLELFLSTPSGIDTPEFSDLRIVKIKGSATEELFDLKKGKWGYNIDSIYIEEMAVHTGQNPKPGLKYIVLDKIGNVNAFYAYTRENDKTTLNRYTLNGQDVSFSVSYPRGSTVDLVKTIDDALLLNISSRYQMPENIEFKGTYAEILSWEKPLNMKMKLPIIADMGESNDIFVPNGVGQIIRLAYTEKGLVEKWSVDGYGGAFQYDDRIDYGVAAEDLNGDGAGEIIIRVNGEMGGGVKSVDANGKTLWQTEFPNIPSGEVYSFRGNVGYFAAADIYGKKALIVTAQRHIQHTGITFGLDGSTGEILWTLESIRKFKDHESGAGSYYLSVYDLNQDGVDEVMTGYGNNVWAARADTGEVLFENFMRSFWEPLWISKNPNGWVSSILPLPLYIRDGVAKLFFSNAGDSAGTALVNLKMRGTENKAALIWGNKDQYYSNRYNQCLADLDGTGRLVVVEPASLGGHTVMHVIDPETGKMLVNDYTLYGANNAVPIACDINGDGKDDIVVSYGSYLEAITVIDGLFKRLWKLEFPSSISWPVYGDIDGDGYGEIAAAGIDGNLYIVNNR